MSAISSRIEAVKVYHQGATVTRVLTVDKSSVGAGEVTVGQLPLSLADATVRVRVRSVKPAGKELLVRRISVGLAPRVPMGEHEGPSPDEIDAKAREVIEKKLERAHIASELAAAEVLEVPERPEGEEGRPPPSSPMAARVALEAFRAEAVDARVSELRALDDVLETLEEELANLQRRAAEASNANRVEPGDLAKVVHAGVEGEGVESAEVELEYFVPGARWAPAYQCHLARDGSETQVHVRAVVCQRTGEDWKGVKLRLSTASAMRWSELPELSSIRIGRAQPTPPPVGFRPPPRGAAQLFGDYDRRLASTRSLVPSPSSWSGPSFSVSMPQVGIAGVGTRSAPRSAPKRRKVSRNAVRMEEMVPEEPDMAKEAFGLMDDSDELDSLDADFEAATPADGYEASEVMSIGPPMAMAAMAPPPAPAGGGMARTRSSKQKSAPAPSDDDLGTIHFHQLVLGGAEDASRRSRLMPASLRDRYQESLARAGVDLAADPISVVQHAQEVARGALHTPIPNGGVDVRKVAGHFDFLYEGETPVDVPSDAVFHSVPLAVIEAEAQLKYVVVPREDVHVFRVATVKNPTLAPLLSGPTEVYVAGEYVLTTNIPTVGPAGEFRLGLGVEQAIKCARNTHYTEKRSGEKVVAMNELEHAVDIEIANRLSREIECEVRERVPFPSKGAEVVVEELSVKPKWTPYDQVERDRPIEGGRRWVVKVAAGEKAQLRAEYVVRIYANNELVGGNRREA